MNLPEKCPRCECPMLSGIIKVRKSPSIEELSIEDPNHSIELYKEYKCCKCDYEWQVPQVKTYPGEKPQ